MLSLELTIIQVFCEACVACQRRMQQRKGSNYFESIERGAVWGEVRTCLKVIMVMYQYPMDFVIVLDLVQEVSDVRDGGHHWYVDGFTVLVQVFDEVWVHILCVPPGMFVIQEHLNLGLLFAGPVEMKPSDLTPNTVSTYGARRSQLLCTTFPTNCPPLFLQLAYLSRNLGISSRSSMISPYRGILTSYTSKITSWGSPYIGWKRAANGTFMSYGMVAIVSLR